MFAPELPTICVGLRGMIYTELEVRGATGSGSASYRYALEHLTVAEPMPVAAEAERILTELQQQIAGNQIVPLPRFGRENRFLGKRGQASRNNHFAGGVFELLGCEVEPAELAIAAAEQIHCLQPRVWILAGAL